MTTQRANRSAFPLRFENERTREAMIARELGVLALDLESTLSRTIELLRSYRGEGRAEAWAAFADGEALHEPIAARRTQAEEDPFGVARTFHVEA